MDKFYFYILRLQSGQIYIGSTTNIEQRYNDHKAGRACRTTQLDPPKKLLYTEEYVTFSDARKREAQVKKWTRAKKEALIGGNIGKLKLLSKRRNK